MLPRGFLRGVPHKFGHHTLGQVAGLEFGRKLVAAVVDRVMGLPPGEGLLHDPGAAAADPV